MKNGKLWITKSDAARYLDGLDRDVPEVVEDMMLDMVADAMGMEIIDDGAEDDCPGKRPFVVLG